MGSNSCSFLKEKFISFHKITKEKFSSNITKEF